jgi:DNA repair exonuclease SbcCD ATPase subunit
MMPYRRGDTNCIGRRCDSDGSDDAQATGAACNAADNSQDCSETRHLGGECADPSAEAPVCHEQRYDPTLAGTPMRQRRAWANETLATEGGCVEVDLSEETARRLEGMENGLAELGRQVGRLQEESHRLRDALDAERNHRMQLEERLDRLIRLRGQAIPKILDLEKRQQRVLLGVSALGTAWVDALGHWDDSEEAAERIKAMFGAAWVAALRHWQQDSETVAEHIKELEELLSLNPDLIEAVDDGSEPPQVSASLRRTPAPG